MLLAIRGVSTGRLEEMDRPISAKKTNLSNLKPVAILAKRSHNVKPQFGLTGAATELPGESTLESPGTRLKKEPYPESR